MDNFTNNLVHLKSKLLQPNITDTIDRERLHPLFVEIKNKRIITVTAGAGYGKTIFAAQVCRYLNLNTVWYRLDTSDCDFLTFINYLIVGIKQHYADFGSRTINRIDATQSVKREQRAIINVLLSEIEEFVSEDLIIALDDYHLVHESQGIKDILSLFTEYLPEMVHLIILSRNVPELNLSRFIARRESFDIGETELSFTIKETDILYRDIFHNSLNKKNLTTLHEQTEGWASGLILFNYSIAEKNDKEIEEQLSTLHFSRKVFFNYLEENIYASLDENVIDFILKTSVLSELDIQFCNQLLGINNSREILSFLEKKHLFTFPFDERKESYYYHHLFQNFLKQKLSQTLDDKSRGQFFSRAADICVKFGKPEEAVQHYLSAQLYEEASGLLSKLGRQLISGARLNIFFSFFKKIPDKYIEGKPWIRYSYARALELSGKVHEAIEEYKYAQSMFQERNIIKGIGLSLNRLFSNYYIIGDFHKAEANLIELLKGIQSSSRLYVDVLGHLIFITSHIGKLEEADGYLDKAMKVLPEIKETDLQAWIYINQGFRFFSSGDFLEAESCGEKSNKLATRLILQNLLTYSYHLISISNYYLGNFTKGFDAALKGLKISQERGLRDATHAWLFIDASFCASAKGDILAAIEYGHDGLKISEELESSWSEAWACHALQDAYFKGNDVIKAEEFARLSITKVDYLTLPYDEAVMKLGLASILIEKGDPDNAGPILSEAEKMAGGSKFNLCRTYIWYARYYWMKNKMPSCIKKLSAALVLSEKNHYDSWIIAEKRWIIPLLVSIYPEKELQNYLNKIFLNPGLSAVSTLKQLEKSKDREVKKTAGLILTELNRNYPSNLKIYCFGKFRLFRGEKEVPPENWSSEKSKMLFKYLCLQYSRGYIIKDRLLELLWPDENPGKTNNRFHVALTTLRKILEPELPKAMLSSYLLREKDAYQLKFTDEGYLDIQEFDNMLALAKKENNTHDKLGYYLKAAALYTGHLFEEDQYTQWCLEARDVYKEKQMHILNYLISYYEEEKDHLQCIEYAKLYLEIDEYSEHVYRILMKQYNETGSRGMVKKIFEQCKSKMEDLLGGPPGRETIQLYNACINGSEE